MASPDRSRSPASGWWHGAADRFATACFGATCWACSRRLATGQAGLWCEACATAVEPASQAVAAGPGGLPVHALWRYGGAVADAIGHAKASGRPPRLAPLWRPWQQLVALATPRDAHLCAVAPHAARLTARGWHLPDQLVRLAGRPALRLLQRSDSHGPRRQGRDQTPRFSAVGGAGQIVLIDDVVTSGVTLASAASALERAGWRAVAAVVLADARSGPAGMATMWP